MSHINVPCLEIAQPIGSYYVAVMSAKDVVHISYSDVRRLESRELEEYLGIQRPLEARRVKELQAYVRTIDAAFPTGIILYVGSDDVEYDPEGRTMRIRYDEDVAKIIDGQHRIAGLEGFGGTFDLSVVLFVDMDIEDQANVFSTINLTQTKVNKSLVYDLFEYAKTRSPQKTCHQVCKVLNTVEGSPFYHRIKVLGVADKRRKERLTQALFVETLMRYVSKDPKSDRDLIKRRRRPADDQSLMFRHFFLEEQDEMIARIVWNYFDAVRLRWPDAWESDEAGSLMNRSTGFSAFMRFLRPAYLTLRPEHTLPSARQFLAIMETITLTAEDFSIESMDLNYGSGGASTLYKAFMEQSGLDENGQTRLLDIQRRTQSTT